MLAPVGRREIDRDARERVREAGIADGAADPLARLGERGVRQPHDLAGGQPRRDVDLDPDELAPQAADDSRIEDREHARQSGQRRFTTASPAVCGRFVVSLRPCLGSR